MLQIVLTPIVMRLDMQVSKCCPDLGRQKPAQLTSDESRPERIPGIDLSASSNMGGAEQCLEW